MNRLYPLKFKPIIKDKIWGGTRLKDILRKPTKSNQAGESWEISGYPGNLSKVKNGFLAGNTIEEIIEVYMGDIVGDGVFDRFGTLFPLLIKFIDANDALSVQVHPDDQLALKQFGSFGKTEMWYVIGAEKDSEIIVGFNQKVDKPLYEKHMQDNNLLAILNKEKAMPGDVFFLPAGRIHAIGAGVLLAEIQQTSDATLRIFDFNRLDDKGKPRELHTEKALEAINFDPVTSFKTDYHAEINKAVNLATCEYFTTNVIRLDREIERDYSQLDSFVVYMCIKGNFDIGYYQTDIEKVSVGDSVLLPADIKNVRLIPEPKAEIIEVYIEGLKQQDHTEQMLDALL